MIKDVAKFMIQVSIALIAYDITYKAVGEIIDAISPDDKD